MLRFFGFKRNEKDNQRRRANTEVFVNTEEDAILQKIDDMLAVRKPRATTSITPESIEAGRYATNISRRSRRIFSRSSDKSLSLESQISAASAAVVTADSSGETRRRPYRISQSSSIHVAIDSVASAVITTDADDNSNNSNSFNNSGGSNDNNNDNNNTNNSNNNNNNNNNNDTDNSPNSSSSLPLKVDDKQQTESSTSGMDIGDFLAIPDTLPIGKHHGIHPSTPQREFTPPLTPVSVVLPAADDDSLFIPANRVSGGSSHSGGGRKNSMAPYPALSSSSPLLQPFKQPPSPLLSPTTQVSSHQLSNQPNHHHHQVQQQAVLVPVDKHILQVGFLGGQHYDIQIGILGKIFRLHRLLLCRSPFFSRLLAARQDQQQQHQQLHHRQQQQHQQQQHQQQQHQQQQQQQQYSVETPLELNISDPTILGNPLSVDICLAWLYGLPIPFATSADDGGKSMPLPSLEIYGFPASPDFTAMFQINTVNVLAVMICAHLFQLTELSQKCLQFICEFELAPLLVRRQVARRKFMPYLSPDECEQSIHLTSTQSLLRYAKFLDSADYGQLISGRVEEQFLAYLCSEGFSSLADLFTVLPLHWLDRILEADAFFAPTEFRRYQFIRDLIQRRRLRSAKQLVSLVADQEAESRVYLDLLRYAVIYTHMTFEELDEIRKDGLVPEDLLMKSLWQQTRFKSLIESTSNADGSRLQNAKVVNGGDAIIAGKRDEVSSIPPIRVGLQFDNVEQLSGDQRRYSQTFFYGGCWWNAFLQRFDGSIVSTKQSENEQQQQQQQRTMGTKWGVFIRRSEHGRVLTNAAVKGKIASSTSGGDNTTVCGEQQTEVQCPLVGCQVERSVSYFNDPRRAVRARFKLFNPHLKIHEPIFESRENDYIESQSWGYRSQEQIVPTKLISATDSEESESSNSGPVSIRCCLVFRYL